MNDIMMDFDDNDFIIRLSPILDKDGNWDGNISVGILTTPDNSLDEEDFSNLMHLTTMVTASLPLMEDNVDFRKKLSRYADKMNEEDAEDEAPKPKAEKLQDNVIQLKF